MNQQQRHELRQQAEATAAQKTTASGEQDFATVEDLLRHDREQNPPPAKVADRLASSIAAQPPAPAKLPWWKRLFDF